MAIRNILYGYQVKNGKMVVHEKESEIVKSVFRMYVEGNTLSSIADSLTRNNVVYFQGEAKWNKNTINRMLENEKYKGNDIYPTIIPVSLFNQAKEIKEKKSCKQIKQTSEIELLRSITVCGKCGSRYKRVNTWGSREKWMCSKGCTCLTYIDDSVLEKAITDSFNSVIRNADLLDVIINSQYKPTRDIIKEENELVRLLEQPKLDFMLISKSIMSGAKNRFRLCDFDNGELTEKLKEEISEYSIVEHINYSEMKKYIRQVIIQPDGRVTSVYVNNSKITANGGAEYGSQYGKNGNKN